jgi:advillin
MSSEAVDPAFQDEMLGKLPGMVRFRIENKLVVRQETAGPVYFEGDSYILLVTVAQGSKLVSRIHFWLGKDSSQDEMGIAAYKTVELDTLLGGNPVQYREAQGYESKLFLSYYKDMGLEYCPGGVESGFQHVEHEYRTRLLHLKGRRVIRSREVNLSTSSLNTGDVFILDAGLKLYLWYGPKANTREKAKGVEVVSRIRDDERGARAEVIFMEEDPTNQEFWNALGGYADITSEGEPDELEERVLADQIKLFRVSDATGSMSIDQVTVPDGKLRKDMLATEDVFILDAGRREIFVWIGRRSTPEEKKRGMVYAAQYVEQEGRPAHTPVARIVEFAETVAFKGYFFLWDPPKMPNYLSRDEGGAGIAKIADEPTNFANLSGRMKSGNSKFWSEADEVPVDDGSGKLQVWRVENFARVAWPQPLFGQFYSGDSYVLLYTYYNSSQRREENIIYFWQGRESTQDEKGSSALLSAELDKDMGGSAVQVRVIQGKEPKHFRSLFKGKMVCHSGGHASGFANTGASDSYDVDGIALFHVKGSNPDNTYGVQVPEVASSLNSGDAFVLVTPATVYCWQGRHCLPEEVDVAKKIAVILEGHLGVTGRSQQLVEEGEEPEAFWDALGGKGEYPEAAADEVVSQEPRLFQVSNATGRLGVEELENFDQTDLCNDDVMLLDTVTNVYVWVGQNSNEQERRDAITLAAHYIETSTDGRDANVPIVQISAGYEPTFFTQHFRGWDTELLKKTAFVDPFEAKMQALKAKQQEVVELAAEASKAPVVVTPVVVQVDASPSSVPAGASIPYADLKGIGKVIPGVDASAREQRLSDEQFQQVFGMDKAAFAKLPKWKQVAAKRGAELF